MTEQKRRGRKPAAKKVVKKVLDKTQIDEQIVAKVDELKAQLEAKLDKLEDKVDDIPNDVMYWIKRLWGHLLLIPFTWYAVQDNFLLAWPSIVPWVAWKEWRLEKKRLRKLGK